MNDEDPGLQEFLSLFEPDLERLRELAGEYDVSLSSISDCYWLIAGGERSMICHDELVDEFGGDCSAWNAASVLVDVGDVHRTRRRLDSDTTEWWWVVAPERLVETCRERKISVQRYIEMKPVLEQFQEDLIDWHRRREIRGVQNRTMRELKREYCEELLDEYFDEDEVPENSYDHCVAYYVKTAEEMISLTMNLSY